MGVISVQGSGTVKVQPDVAVISFRVETQGKRTSEAVLENNQRMKELLEVVEKFNIDPKDRRTAGFGIQPVWERYAAPKSGQKQKPPKIIGYNASNGLNIMVRDVEQVSNILGALTDAGAGEMHLGFDVDKPQQHEDKARELGNLHISSTLMPRGFCVKKNLGNRGATKKSKQTNTITPLKAASFSTKMFSVSIGATLDLAVT